MLELNQLHHSVPTESGPPRWLLRGVNLTVPPGETVAVLGPSGSGKSSLLKVVAGLVPADAGTVLWAGQDVSGWPPERRRFALMFQDFALFPHLDVLDNVAFGLVEQRLSKAQAREQARAMLGHLHLAHRAADRVTVLSGGEQQRVALARALVTNPKVLLLDEPFSALDADLRLQLRPEFQHRLASAGMACVWVTHDEAEARAVAQRGYRLVDGQLNPLW